MVDALVLASKKYLGENDFPLRFLTINLDRTSPRILRYIPVSMKEREALFTWEGMCLSWMQAKMERQI